MNIASNDTNPDTANLLLATHCAVCGRALFAKDLVSQSWGVGPDCRKSYGVEKADARSDWGKALVYLGPDFPAVIYDAIVKAHAERHGYDVTEDAWIETTLKDVQPAIKVLAFALATAPRNNLKSEHVARIILAIGALGHNAFAVALAKGWATRRECRYRWPLAIVRVKSTAENAWEVRTDSYQVTDALRNLPHENRSFARYPAGTTRTYGARRDPHWNLVNVSRESLFALLKKASPDLVVGNFVVAGRVFAESAEPARECWTDACKEEDRTLWVNRETGEFARYVIPGEAMHRPGFERVPAAYIQKGGAS